MSTENFYDSDIYDMLQGQNHTGGNRTLSCNTDTVEFRLQFRIIISISCALPIFGALLVILKVTMKPPYNGLQQRQPLTDVAMNATGQYRNGARLESEMQVQSGNLTDVENGNAGTQNSNRCKFCSNLRVVSRPAVIILISISVADILVAVSHLWGVLSAYVEGSQYNKTHTKYNYAECGAQAFVTVYGTISSLLWSDVLMFIAVIMYWCSRKNIERFTSVYAFVVYSTIGWVVPFLVATILGGGLDAFGFGDGLGWCYMNLENGHQKEDLLISWFSYGLWANASILFICCSAIYLLIIVCADWSKPKTDGENETSPLVIQNQDENTRDNNCKVFRCGRRKQLACKMVTAAIFVVVLRVWILIVQVYLFKPEGSQQRNDLVCNTVLQILSGIGTSSQGIVNAVLFVVTPGLVTLCRLCINKKK